MTKWFASCLHFITRLLFWWLVIQCCCTSCIYLVMYNSADMFLNALCCCSCHEWLHLIMTAATAVYICRARYWVYVCLCFGQSLLCFCCTLYAPAHVARCSSSVDLPGQNYHLSQKWINLITMWNHLQLRWCPSQMFFDCPVR